MSSDLTNGHMEEPSAGEDAPKPERGGLDQAAQDWVAGVKEREELRKQIQEKDSELLAAQKKVYELMKKVETLEGRLELRELNIRAQALLVNHSAANDLPKRRRHPKRRKKKKGAKDKTKEEKDEDEDEQDTYRYYTEIAEKFPNMKLSTILDAEKKFVAADEDGNGTIDEGELEKILDTDNTMFTKDQVKGIMKEVDLDDTGNLDFLECLAIMDRLQSHRKTNLPSSLQNNKSNVCVVQ
ncbi:myb-like protein X [Branchiostoma floridae]|uniref:Myb-like protein X n=1 Tax=Branchiostoma floridae TaxID=7739 RepID=A0A9J7L770_BRAFL|nr:myb-like protein X [Branchiostoma floridae]